MTAAKIGTKRRDRIYCLYINRYIWPLPDVLNVFIRWNFSPLCSSQISSRLNRNETKAVISKVLSMYKAVSQTLNYQQSENMFDPVSMSEWKIWKESTLKVQSTRYDVQSIVYVTKYRVQSTITAARMINDILFILVLNKHAGKPLSYCCELLVHLSRLLYNAYENIYENIFLL